jgi:hypothetical protein
MGFIAPALPWIAKGAGMLGGVLAGRHAQKKAMERTPEEQVALGQAQQVGGTLRQTGSGLLSTGQTTQAPATDYWDTLLRGNRARQSQAVAPGVAAAQDVARGEERSLERSGVRGAARDVAAADIGRRRASTIAGLVTGVQPIAAQQLTDIGQTQINQGGVLTSNAGSLFANLLGQGARRNEYAREEGRRAGESVGGFIRDIVGSLPFGKQKAGPTLDDWHGGR